MTEDILLINGLIDDEVMNEVLMIDRASASERLILIINTPGGNPAVAYRSMTHLQAFYKEIYAIVPDSAMSAGTLMCLGADKIFMKEGSSLGPLDLQVPHPNDGGQISTLDIREANYDIFALAAAVTKKLYEQSRYDLGIGKVDSAKMAHESAVQLLRPMVEKIDPYHLHASFRNSAIGQKYARILLSNRMMKGDRTQASETSMGTGSNPKQI